MLRFLSRIFLITVIFVGIGAITENISSIVFPKQQKFNQIKQIIFIANTEDGVKKISVVRLDNANYQSEN